MIKIKFPYSNASDVDYCKQNKIWDIPVSTGPLSNIQPGSLGFLWPDKKTEQLYGDSAKVAVLVNLSKPTPLNEQDRVQWPSNPRKIKSGKPFRYTASDVIILTLGQAKEQFPNVSKIRTNQVGVYVN